MKILFLRLEINLKSTRYEVMPVKKLDVKSLYEEKCYQEMVQRVHDLTPQSTPGWGKMDVAQMLAHCAEVQEVMNGKQVKVPFYMKLFSGFIKKMVTNTKPYTKNLPTAPDYVKVGVHNFEEEKQYFLDVLQIFFENRTSEKEPHPVFGKMTDLERGWAMYKHHDHHLKQFGV